MNNKILKIQDRINKASTGTWKAFIEGKDFSSGSSCIVILNDKNIEYKTIDLSGATAEDIEFIANAKQDIIYLLNEIQRIKQGS